MDPVDIVITTILKTASSEAVKGGLAALSERIRRAFADADHDEIKKAVVEEGISSKLAEIASSGLEDSDILQIKAKGAKPRDKVDLFQKILEIGFQVSHTNNMDVIVKGSIASERYVSIFSSRSMPENALSRLDPLNIEINSTNQGPFYAILPAKDPEKLSKLYQKKAVEIRNESERYIPISAVTNDLNTSSFRINKISAGSVYPLFSVVFKEAGVNLTDGRILIENFSDGISEMMDGWKIYSELIDLDEDEREKLRRIADRMARS